jgi:CRISPR-associated protein Cas1
MGFHIVQVDTPMCSLSCSLGQLRQRTQDGVERSLPLEDVAAIVITSFSCTIHSKLLLECAKLGVALILCESFKPLSLVLPANRSTDTTLTKAFMMMDEKTRIRLWRRCVDAKCANQTSLAAYWETPEITARKLATASVSDNPSKEAICARLYWRVFAKHVNAADFIRDRSAGGLNDLLNFGYSVLLSVVLQKLLAVGLDPTFGISHAVRERATPLAYDLMEPFRPCVDWRVVRWLYGEGKKEPLGVTKAYRRWMVGVVTESFEHEGCAIKLQACIECTTRSFRRAVMENDVRRYKPWIQKSLKWAG